jgi:tetratricopeptide (TPR) repeat protein
MHRGNLKKYVFCLCLCGLPFIHSIGYAQKSLGKELQVDVARSYLLNGKMNEAISTYSQLLEKDSTNLVLIGEDAYALALGGFHEAALIRLDRLWNMKENWQYSSSYVVSQVFYFVSKVLSLTGSEDLASEFRNTERSGAIPVWIDSRTTTLENRYRLKSPKNLITKGNKNDDFKMANMLSSKKLFFQAAILFQEVMEMYPDEYLGYMGYSITLEKMGFYDLASKALQKALPLTSEDAAKKTAIENHMAFLQKQLKIDKNLKKPLIGKLLPDLRKLDSQDILHPQMIYVGGMLTPSLTSLSGKFGYFFSNTFNASADLSTLFSSSYSSASLGTSAYMRLGSEKLRNLQYAIGTGLLVNLSNGDASLKYKLSFGICLMNKKRNSSFDIFWDCNIGLNTPTVFGASMGKSFYFGKR